MRISNLILKPIITEKSFNAASNQFYTFKVSMFANKTLVSKELKSLYGVDAEQVNIQVLPGKKKRVIGTRKFKTQPKFKKAIVKIKKGQTIDIFTKE